MTDGDGLRPQEFRSLWRRAFEEDGLSGRGHRPGGVGDEQDLKTAGRVAAQRARHEVTLLRLPNVVGVAAAFKATAGRIADQPCVSVLVERKAADDELADTEKVPPDLDGVPTDVLEVGRPQALAYADRVRPAQPGYSVGHPLVTAGTFGCLVHDRRSNERRRSGPADAAVDALILSNNHVLAASNRGQPGDATLQPGPADGGEDPTDRVAVLERAVTLVPGQYNLVDAAVSRPVDARLVRPDIAALGTPTGVDQGSVGTRVAKSGRTSQTNAGWVISTDATVVVDSYPWGQSVFRNQLLTTGMAEAGDSGSLLVDERLAAVGLLFAGSSFVTIHNPITNVELALDVRVLTAT